MLITRIVWVISVLFLLLLDVFVITTFLNSVLGKKKIRFLFTIIAVIIACVKIAGANQYVFSFSSLVGYCVLSSFYVIDWKRKLFYSFILYAFDFASLILVFVAMQAFLGVNMFEHTQAGTVIMLPIGAAIAKFMVFIVVQIMRRVVNNKDGTMPLSNWMMVMCIPINSVLMQYGMAMDALENDMRENIRHLLILVGLVSVNILAFVAYDRFSMQAKKQIAIERANSHMESEIRRHELIVSESKELSAFMHDMTLHLTTIHDLLEDNKSETALSYINKIHFSPTVVYEGIIVSSIYSVDTVIRRKIAEAENLGIAVKHDVSIPCDVNVDDIELCVILGNSMDNAIEGCMRVSDYLRQITIDIRYEQKRLAIRIANSSEPVEIKNGKCKSSKGEKDRIGYGLSNIRKVVSKYGGNMIIQYQEGMFVLNILIFP